MFGLGKGVNYSTQIPKVIVSNYESHIRANDLGRHRPVNRNSDSFLTYVRFVNHSHTLMFYLNNSMPDQLHF